MTSKVKKLINHFEELKELEVQARDLYESCLKFITHPMDKKLMLNIIHDEERHAAMVDAIIHVLELKD